MKCTVGRMLDTLKEKRNELKAEDLEHVLVDSVFSATDKQGFLQFKFKNQTLETEIKREHPLTDQGLLQRSGIKVRVLKDGVQTIQYFSAFSQHQSKQDKKKPCARPDKYGYHWGTQTMVDALHLHEDNPPVPHFTPTSSIRLTPTQSMDDFVQNTKKDNERMDTKLDLNKTFLENRIIGLEKDIDLLQKKMGTLLSSAHSSAQGSASPTTSKPNDPSLHGENPNNLMSPPKDKPNHQKSENKSSNEASQASQAVFS